MKLLYCRECGCIRSIKIEITTCDCGKVKARYLDVLKIIWNGEGKILGINNSSLQYALKEEEKSSRSNLLGVEFESFVVPKCESVVIQEDL